MEKRNFDVEGRNEELGGAVQWSAEEPPGAFGVYDEGDGLLSVYMTPFRLETLIGVVRRLRIDGALLDVTPLWGVRNAQPIAVESLLGRDAPLELLHATSLDEIPETFTLMADPHEALPKGSGRRFALSLHDADHAVLYCRGEDTCAAFLSAWLRERIHSLANTTEAPPLDDHALQSVLEPLPIEAWRRLVLERCNRYWALDVSAVASDLEGTEAVVDELRWVGDPSRSWRAGWSW